MEMMGTQNEEEAAKQLDEQVSFYPAQTATLVLAEISCPKK